MLEDRLLVCQFKCGSSKALCQIYRKYGDYLLALSAALLQDVNAAEDVVHDVFCKFIESRERFKLDGSLKSFLATCTLNLARDVLRARQSQPGGLDAAAATASDASGPQHAAIFGEETRNLNRAMAQLAYEQREVILLRLRGGMKFKEIARAQASSINTVKSRYRYGLENLRELLTDNEKENELAQQHRKLDQAIDGRL